MEILKKSVNSRLIYTTHMRMDIYQHDRFGVYHQNKTL